MLDRLKRLLPSHDSIASNRWLRWLGPALLHRSLWHMSRRGVAKGAAIGVFFAFITPIAQIPLSAALSVALRANIPTAIAATLVNTPPTFGPVYYAAWRVGSWMLGEEADAAHTPEALRVAKDGAEAKESGAVLAGVAVFKPGFWARHWSTLREIGKPLMLGALVFSVVFSALAYVLVNLVWHWRVRGKRRKRLRSAATSPP
ncbi:MAG: DUF2062 domain-containing protein [Rhodoferax sp.]|nr:DUF2062 domain-containing protein [Rhodoferax sp.]